LNILPVNIGSEHGDGSRVPFFGRKWETTDGFAFLFLAESGKQRMVSAFLFLAESEKQRMVSVSFLVESKKYGDGLCVPF
jgi:hypothetical protein